MKHVPLIFDDMVVDVDIDDGDVVVEEIPVCSFRRCWQKRGRRTLLTAENSNIPFHPNLSLHERFK